MDFCSTRDNKLKLQAADVLLKGISTEGGLFIPTALPRLTDAQLEAFMQANYAQLAGGILSLLLPGFDKTDMESACSGAYGAPFGNADPAPLHVIDDKVSVLELFQGPTCAFKDMALQVLPRVFPLAKKLRGDDATSVILVATSGDTGKAALEGFCDIPGTGIMVVYPRHGVSDTQRLQMITQRGKNVFVAGIDGNFDDAQRAVKHLMTDAAIIDALDAKNMNFSSANSINWGRLAPQVVYYFYAYAKLLGAGRLVRGESVDFCVPSGNFGNILAGYIAKQMGLPVGRLISASNENDVLCDFINTGVYNADRKLIATISPSMDILVSSNVERLVFMLAGGDSSRVAELFAQLQNERLFELSGSELAALQRTFSGYRTSEAETKATIARVFGQHGYLIDPHTAVGFDAARQYNDAANSASQLVVLSTASPYKFAGDVLAALGINAAADNELAALESASGVPVPAPLRGLGERAVRFDNCYEVDELSAVLNNFTDAL